MLPRDLFKTIIQPNIDLAVFSLAMYKPNPKGEISYHILIFFQKIMKIYYSML